MQEEKTKSLPVSKRMVYDSYLKTVSKQGGAGIDRESIEMFNPDFAVVQFMPVCLKFGDEYAT